MPFDVWQVTTQLYHTITANMFSFSAEACHNGKANKNDCRQTHTHTHSTHSKLSAFLCCFTWCKSENQEQVCTGESKDNEYKLLEKITLDEVA